MMSDKDNNLLKSDILTAGNELSEKLNDIGVPNTFGKASEGKDNLISIIRMTINGIDMIIEKIREILRDYYNKSEVNTLLNGKSDTSHNHDSAYAKISHNHDNAYYNKSEVNTLLNGKSDTSHNHDSAYASKNHNHDTAYASKSHQHDSAYAKISHNHDNAYASKSHQHDGADVILSNSNDVGTEIGNIEADITSINGDITSLNNSITDIDTTVNNHTTKFTNMIEIRNWEVSNLSLASGASETKTLTVPNPSGYYRVPIIQGAYKCYASSLNLSENTLTVKIQNHYSTKANASIYGKVLYFKSSIIKEI